MPNLCTLCLLLKQAVADELLSFSYFLPFSFPRWPQERVSRLVFSVSQASLRGVRANQLKSRSRLDLKTR